MSQDRLPNSMGFEIMARGKHIDAATERGLERLNAKSKDYAAIAKMHERVLREEILDLQLRVKLAQVMQPMIVSEVVPSFKRY